jgi:cytochrome c553
MKNPLVHGLVAAAALVAATMASPAPAAVDPPAAAAPAGIGACQACHGPHGISSSNIIPNLAGQKSDYLVAQLTAFKKGERKNDYMTVIAGQLSEADMQSYAQYWSAQPAASSVPQAAKAVPAIPSRATLPRDFPTNYTVYETVKDAESGTVTKRYANTIALRAAHAGTALPDGSVIIVTNELAKPDPAGKAKVGEVRSYAVMEARAGWGASVPALLRNGNWDYAVYGADRVRKDGLNQALCLACHRPAAADSYVFTLKALRGAASKPVS